MDAVEHADDDRDDLEDTIDELERRNPGTRQRIEELTEIVRVTTALWRRREELGMSVEEVAARSGLPLDTVEAIEDNAVDTPIPDLARYANAVGLRIDLRVTAA